MNVINKYQSLIIGLTVILGLLLGQVNASEAYAEHLIVPFLMIMLFGLFLNIPLKDLLKSFSDPGYVFFDVPLAPARLDQKFLEWLSYQFILCSILHG